MASEPNTADPFPRRFVVSYSLEEALRIYDRRARRQASLAGSGQSWTRLIILALLASVLSGLAQAYGALSQTGLPLVATLLSGAFILGVYAAWMEVGSITKRSIRVLHDQGVGFGPWDVDLSGEALVGSSRGYGFRLNWAAIREVALDDLFVTLTIDQTLNFAIPRRCLGGDRAVEAFKGFVEAMRGA
jgi:hypothetical protein